MQEFNPFRVNVASGIVNRLLEWLLGLSKLAGFYDRRPRDLSAGEFLDYTLDCLNANSVYVDNNDVLSSIPETGPLLVVANHPLGGLEGVALARRLLDARSDLKVLTNELLTRIPELSDLFVGVDVLSGKGHGANRKGLLTVTRHLQQGGALLIFPAGKVANFHLKKQKVYDHDWNRLVGHLTKKAKPVVLPLFVEAINSRLFYLAAAIHPILRALMLPRELSNKNDFKLTVHVGDLIKPGELQRMEDVQAITYYLRLSTEFACIPSKAKQYTGVQFAPLKEVAIESDAIELPASDYLLSQNDDYAVYCAPYDALGDMMTVIGEARELTFRAAGEGTGNPTDIDRFDEYYLHLFVWDRRARQVAGGYRIGKVDEILAARGVDALYSRTLYRFNESYLLRLGKALEMGRSFVHPDYQRQSNVLDLLWKGIGLYVARNPEYHTLFGAVSISNEHSDLARALIAESMLESFRAEQRYLDDVKPEVPLKISGKVWTKKMLASLCDVSMINKLIGRCDAGKALPTLLRHYLALNGRFVCFSINKVFNDSLDGLIIVDLRETPQKYLDRYLGKEGAANAQQVWEKKGLVKKIA